MLCFAQEPTYVSKLFNLQVQYNNIVIPKDAYKNYDKRRIDNVSLLYVHYI